MPPRILNFDVVIVRERIVALMEAAGLPEHELVITTATHRVHRMLKTLFKIEEHERAEKKKLEREEKQIKMQTRADKNKLRL